MVGSTTHHMNALFQRDEPLEQFNSVTVLFANANSPTLIVPANMHRRWLVIFDPQGSGLLRIRPVNIDGAGTDGMMPPVQNDSLKFTVDRDGVLPTLEWWAISSNVGAPITYWEVLDI